MLNLITAIKGSRVLASDGEIGKVKDIYFDDDRWVVRYLVVDTGGWLTGRHVLISPYAVTRTDRERGSVSLDITRAKVERSPDIDTNRPVSRQHEAEYFQYFGYPAYWPSSTFWAGGATPIMQAPDAATRIALETQELKKQIERRESADCHLRSASAVISYAIQANDGSVGHAEDFLFDDQTWAISCLIVDTGNWLPGKHVILSRESIQAVDWHERTVSVDYSRADIEKSPMFDAAHLPAAATVDASSHPRP